MAKLYKSFQKSHSRLSTNNKIFVVGMVLFFMIISVSWKNAGPVKPPAETNDFSKLTAYKPMMTYLTELSSRSKHVSMTMIGKSVQGRDIPALFFTSDKKFASHSNQKPLVLIFCQQHGNEPSGKEAALLVARDLITDKVELLQHFDLILLPQANPDGGEMLQRRNAHNMDLNRNHVVLSEPEALALQTLFLKWKPDIVLDIHEYNSIKKAWIDHGYIKAADEMLGGLSNLNADPSLIEFSRKIFIPETGKSIKKQGFTFHRYTVGMPFPGSRLRHSTTAINDGRQSMGIYNTLAFIIEGRRFADPTQNLKHRTLGQRAALLAFLQTVSHHQRQILHLVSTAQSKLLTGNDEYNKISRLQMDYFPDPLHKTCAFPVFDFYKWKTVTKPLTHYYPLVEVKRSVEKPIAYIFPASETKLIALLKRNRIEMFALKNALDIQAEFYRIQHVTPDREEDKSHKNVDVYEWGEKRNFPKGSVLVFLNQRASNLIPLLLEPQSSYGIVSKSAMHQYCFTDYLKIGREYPVARIVQPVDTGNLEKLPE